MSGNPQSATASTDKYRLNTIEEAIEDIKAGKLVIVVDDEDRENEGDFITAARNVTPEIINFMATHGRGLICAPIVEDRCDELGLDLMVGANTASHGTPFTVSIDLIGHGCTTGISASDRAKTVQALIRPDTKPEDLGRPGHIFPLRARRGGVLRRSGHTEATIDLARMAGFEPAGVLVEIMNEDGSMARLPQLMEVAERFNLKIIAIKDMIAYRLAQEVLIKKETTVELPTQFGTFTLIAYSELDTGNVHFALTKGKWSQDEAVLLRVHSSNLLGDVLGALHKNTGTKLHQAMARIEQEGKGMVLYMNQHSKQQRILQELKAYELSKKALPVKREQSMEQRDFGVGAQIVRDLGIRKIRLLTDNPRRRIGLVGYGLEIVENVAVS